MSPSALRSQRRQRSLWVLAALSLVGALFSWTGLERRDDGWLLVWAGEAVDLRGRLSAGWTAWLRSCDGVHVYRPGDSAWSVVQGHLAQYSPPDSESAHLISLQQSGPWWLAQATFTTLEPVVVVLTGSQPEALVLQPLGVWSGPTAPWDPAWRIRRFLGSRLPNLPSTLLACVDPALPWQAARRVETTDR